MHAHREMELDLEKIIDLFANLHPRRMRIKNGKYLNNFVLDSH